MIRTYCDRCGKEIGRYGGTAVQWATDLPAYAPYEDGQEGSFDFCKACSLEFMRWIDAKCMDKCEAAGAE